MSLTPLIKESNKDDSIGGKGKGVKQHMTLTERGPLRSQTQFDPQVTLLLLSVLLSWSVLSLSDPVSRLAGVLTEYRALSMILHLM